MFLYDRACTLFFLSLESISKRKEVGGGHIPLLNKIGSLLTSENVKDYGVLKCDPVQFDRLIPVICGRTCCLHFEVRRVKTEIAVPSKTLLLIYHTWNHIPEDYIYICGNELRQCSKHGFETTSIC
jgi:hypothetical protein